MQTHSFDTRRPIHLSNLRCRRATVLVVCRHARARGNARLVNGDRYEQRHAIDKMQYLLLGLAANLRTHRESASGAKKTESRAKGNTGQ